MRGSAASRALPKLLVVFVADIVLADADDSVHCTSDEVSLESPPSVLDASLLQQRRSMSSQGRKSCRSNLDLPQDDEEPPAQEVFGDQVSLDDQGFKLVMEFPCGYERELFVGRVADELGMSVQDSTKLHEWMPVLMHRAREDPAFDMAALRVLIEQASQETNSWLAKSQSQGEKQHPVSLITISGEVRPKRGAAKNKAETYNSDGEATSASDVGNVAPLTENGYHTVAKLKSDRQMSFFVKRTIDSFNLRVVDDGSLTGLVPYYSGTKATQSLSALVEEIARARKKMPHSWLKEKKKHDASPREHRKHRKHLVSHQDDEKGAFIQTESHSQSSSTSSWIQDMSLAVQGYTVYLLGARITAVACIGSLLFGLYLFDESTHRARREKLGEMPSNEISEPPSVTKDTLSKNSRMSVFGQPVEAPEERAL